MSSTAETSTQAWPLPQGRDSAQTLPAVIHDGHQIERNKGMPLDMGIINNIRINTNGVQGRAGEFGARRTVKKDFQAAWLLKAVTLMDLTTLSGDDTFGKVDRLCAKARNPINPKLLAPLGMADKGLTTGAVCVYHEHVKEAVGFLKGTNIPVAAVSTGFPHGKSPFKTRLD